MSDIRDFTTGVQIINTKERNNRVYVVAGTWQNMVSYHPVDNRGETYQKPYHILQVVQDSDNL